MTIFLAFFLLTALIATPAIGGESSTQTPSFEALRVAHAGGGLNKWTYTNSYQALNTNLKKGFIYFELDFVFTKDDQLVCLHDWNANFKRTFGFAAKHKLTLDEFEHVVSKNIKFTNCTLRGLAHWMRDNPLAHIVTDVRGDNIRALTRIRESLPDAANKVIPQIYDPRNYGTVKEMGFEQIIWTIYRYRGDNQEVTKWIDRWNGPFAIAMPKKRAQSTLPRKLKEKRIPSYVHTINDPDEAGVFLHRFSVTEFYTDFLAP